MAEEFIVLITMEVNRTGASVPMVLWGIVTVAIAALDAQLKRELGAANTELLQALANTRELRPATPYDRNELRLSWGEGGPPEERQRG